MNDGCFVRWRLDASEADVRASVRDAVRDAAGTGVAAVLPDVGAQTVTLFLHQPAHEPPGLVWYVEHDGRTTWRDPAAAIRDASPVFDSGLAAYLTDRDDPLVVAAGAPSAASLVHGTLPGRPTAYPDRTDRDPVLLSANDPDADAPDVVAVRLRIRRGLGGLFARAFAKTVALTPDRLEATFEDWTEPILEAEGMYTETLVLERAADGYRLWWYMEAGDLDQVYDAYYESDQRIARISERVLGWVLERPERVLRPRVAANEFAVLLHAVAVDRD